jgi:lysyl-tRNA synthetase class 2
MNIPVLEMTPGGADANPFVTHMDALDQDFYLRITQELYLIRLTGGGYEKIYEIGPRFRNEGISDEHLPEHIAMEFYWADADWDNGMKFIKDLFRYVTEKVYGTTKFKMRGFDVDFGNEWEIIDYAEILRKKFDLDIFNSTPGDLKKILQKNHIETNENINTGRGVDSLWKIIRKDIAGPAFVINVPKFLSPLAKSNPDKPEYAMRFHPVAAGGELGNGFSELNDPLDQYNRFKEQQAMRDSGDNEAQFLDIDFVEMLEYGMPPTLGYGHSERVFWFLEDVTAREGVPFPQLKYEIDSVTKKIYGIK